MGWAIAGGISYGVSSGRAAPIDDFPNDVVAFALDAINGINKINMQIANREGTGKFDRIITFRITEISLQLRKIERRTE